MAPKLTSEEEDDGVTVVYANAGDTDIGADV